MAIERITQVPLYRMVVHRLRVHLRAFTKPGDRLPPERELANQLGVSVLTLREAMSVLARDGAVSRRRGAGTIVLDPTCGQHVAIFSELNLLHADTSFYFRRLIDRIQTGLREQGYSSRIYNGCHPPPPSDVDAPVASDVSLACPELLEDLRRDRVCGVIHKPPATSSVILDAMRATGVPVIPDCATGAFDAFSDYADLIRKGVAYLSAHGRSRIGLITHEDRFDLSIFTSSMQDAGLEVIPDLIKGDQHPSDVGAGWEAFLELWIGRKHNPIDGLIVTDDFLMEDAARAILALDVRVPEQLMVFALANKGARRTIGFPVALWESDPDAAARQLVENMVGLLTGRPVDPAPVYLTGEVVAMESPLDQLVRRSLNRESSQEVGR